MAQDDAMKTIRISTAANLVALIAIDLAFVRMLPVQFFLVPLIIILFASLNLVLSRVLVLRKPLGLFHLGFIGTGLLYGMTTIGLRSHILAMLIDRYRMLTGDATTWRFNSGNQILFTEQILLIALASLACVAGGVLASFAGTRMRSRVRSRPAAVP
jgi:hypothetical protein